MTSQHLTTAELADLLKIRPQTLHKGLCLHGHYLGLKPLKMPNRRLLWPAEAVERLLNPEPAQCASCG